MKRAITTLLLALVCATAVCQEDMSQEHTIYTHWHHGKPVAYHDDGDNVDEYEDNWSWVDSHEKELGYVSEYYERFLPLDKDDKTVEGAAKVSVSASCHHTDGDVTHEVRMSYRGKTFEDLSKDEAIAKGWIEANCHEADY
jgi:hypothetical protein